MAATNPSLRQTIDETLRGFLLGYEDAREKKDPSQVNRLLTPECGRHISPKSFVKTMGMPSDLAFDPKTYEQKVGAEMQVQQVTRTEISNVVIDAEARTAAAMSVHHGECSDGEKFALEFAWFLNFSDDGTKIVKVREWIDGPEAVKFQGKVQSLMEKLKGETA
ncbi:hypothetical protein CPLU01_05475 [Colletotrichum plurivorum]|uniref:SnoaL-like domain-containing protein n=1 Tax=Colletotrichum plurivorum TaxID=2175906 RepID=A0A8H6NHH2_9PEZI|nr:hypothetical protein CPLU01_05475 [Colletotrichum plurivorum]